MPRLKQPTKRNTRADTRVEDPAMSFYYVRTEEVYVRTYEMCMKTCTAFLTDSLRAFYHKNN